jgi:hypothetical protein
MEWFSFYVQTGGTEDTLGRMGELHAIICRGITDKLDAEERRKWYTEYKMCEDESLRENSRQKYLDFVGMKESYRWKSGGLE